jgi:hypothetical protein
LADTLPNTTFGIMDEVRHLLKVEKFDKIIKMIEILILQQIVHV